MKESILKEFGLKPSDFKPKPKQEKSDFIEDEKGNKYRQIIEDGKSL